MGGSRWNSNRAENGLTQWFAVAVRFLWVFGELKLSGCLARFLPPSPRRLLLFGGSGGGSAGQGGAAGEVEGEGWGAGGFSVHNVFGSVGVVLTLILLLGAPVACPVQAQAVQKWMTPTGSLYLGDTPPPRSTLLGVVGEVESNARSE